MPSSRTKYLYFLGTPINSLGFSALLITVLLGSLIFTLALIRLITSVFNCFYANIVNTLYIPKQL